jgi:hypothetical protein
LARGMFRIRARSKSGQITRSAGSPKTRASSREDAERAGKARSDLKPVVSRRGTTALYVAKTRNTRVMSETLTQNVLEVCRLDRAPNAVSRTLGKNHQRVVGLASEWEESRVMGWLRVSAARTWSGE